MIKGKQVFDCFTFFNEKELLELRFMEYYDIVDYFVIVEATKTHTGKPHTPIFESLKPNFKKYLNKVIHVVVDDLPQYSIDDIWKAENFQRNAIERGLKGIAKENDAIFVSDLDEFYNIDKIKECIGKNYPIVFEHDLFYYFVNCKQNCRWYGTCYAPYGLMTPQEMRNYSRFNTNIEHIIKNGGWHYSYMGGAERIMQKVENIAESSIIIDKVKDVETIKNNIEKVNDLWDRKELYAQKRLILLDDYKPKKLDEFLKKYPHFIQKPKTNIELISLIYCNCDYLEMIANEMKKIQLENPTIAVGIRIVANNANKKVIEKLKTLDIPYTIYKDKKPKDYYINRVYRCYNHAVKTTKYDNVCLINSDMLFSKNWLSNLLKYHNGVNIPVSRLIESGKMPSGQYGVSYNCGSHPLNIDRKKWNELSDKMQNEDKNIVKEGGLYMPAIFETKRFLDSGGYPEGNIYEDGSIGTLRGNVIQSGDDYFFHEILVKKFNMKHITVFDSLCYHIQEGERDEDVSVKKQKNKTKLKNKIKKMLLSKEKQGNKRIIRILGIKISYKKKEKTQPMIETEYIPQHTIFIKELLNKCDYKSYLELGVYDGVNFKHVIENLNDFEAVDVKNNENILKNIPQDRFFNITTDEYFSKNQKTFDLIFIDACHNFENVKQDFENSIKILNKGGMILLHDTDPINIDYTQEGYCSDAYKINSYLENKEYNFITIPFSDCGLTIVKKKNENRVNDFIKN